MRASYEIQLLSEDGQAPSSILLGADFCAEHEWGIEDLKRLMGVVSNDEAEEKRLTSFSRLKVSSEFNITHLTKGGVTFVAALKNPDCLDFLMAGKSHELQIPKRLRKGEDPKRDYKPQTTAAWDQGAFVIATRDPQVKLFLNDWILALRQGKAVLHLGSGNNPFKPVSGLVLGIEDRISQEIKDNFQVKWEDTFKLKDESVKTGIEAKLRRAKKAYYALTPRWLKDVRIDPSQTKYPVVYWMNPMDQGFNHAGWYTVEDLLDWIENKGKVLGN